MVLFFTFTLPSPILGYRIRLGLHPWGHHGHDQGCRPQQARRGQGRRDHSGGGGDKVPANMTARSHLKKHMYVPYMFNLSLFPRLVLTTKWSLLAKLLAHTKCLSNYLLFAYLHRNHYLDRLLSSTHKRTRALLCAATANIRNLLPTTPTITYQRP